ncbi:MAG: hypothetical protein Q9201_007351 [Fulgogasparrea decipioides]
MSPPNPMTGSMEGSFPNPPLPVSQKTFTIAGILVTVHGLDELSPEAPKVACLWLLHPRLQTQRCMGPLAAATLNDWNQRKEKDNVGLVAVTFDQRNHGSRKVDPLSNEAWRFGNERHAQDMFSIYRPQDQLPSWTQSSPPGTQFLGSQDFPPGLVKAVEKYDPAGMLLGKPDRPLREISERTPSAVEQAKLLPLMKRSFQGKRVLNLSGCADKLVPYKCGQAFIRWLDLAVRPGSWFADGLHLEDLVFDNVGHQMSPDMVTHALRFVGETLQEMIETPAVKSSKI